MVTDLVSVVEDAAVGRGREDEHDGDEGLVLHMYYLERTSMARTMSPTTDSERMPKARNETSRIRVSKWCFMCGVCVVWCLLCVL